MSDPSTPLPRRLAQVVTAPLGGYIERRVRAAFESMPTMAPRPIVAPAPAPAERELDGPNMLVLTLGGRSVELTGTGDDGDHYLRAMAMSRSDDGFDRVCLSLLPDDGVVIDVGANIGVTTLIAAGRHPAATIHAIEAGPHVYETLTKNLAVNAGPSVHPHHFAVGSESGEVSFSEFSAYGHVVAGGAGVTVPMRTLDDFARDEGLDRVDLIKIDVEGFELPALRGVRALAERTKPLFYVEFNSWTLLAYGRTSPLDFLEYLIATFAHVRFFEPDGTFAVLDESSKLGFLHRNLTEHGCVDDLVFTDDPGRLAPRV